MGKPKRVGWIIQQPQFDELVGKTDRSRARICAAADLDETMVNSRLSRDIAFDEDEVARLAVELNCEIKDFACFSSSAEMRARPGTSGRGDRREALLSVLKNEDMRRRYEAFDDQSFVLVFSLDGYLEAENLHFRDIVFSAMKRGLEVFYLFPDSEVAGRSRAHYEKLAGLAHKEGLKPHGHLVDANNSFIATRAARFVMIGKKDGDNTRLVEEIFLYLHTTQNIWIELDLADHRDFISELQAAIDPIPYMSIPIWKERWHLPPFVQERYQTSFSRDSETYSKLRQIARTDESAQRIATRALRHFTDIGFDRDNDVIHWLDVGCEDGSNTAVIFDFLRTHHFNVALTAIDTSWQAEVSDVLKYTTFLHGKRWTFEHFSSALPRHQKFDLITSLHSWYVIDPIYLVEAYRRLSQRGMLIVTMGPHDPSDDHRGNFINMATGAVDNLIAKGSRLKPADDLYLHKIVRSDPYRNYAEDILEACKQFFGNQDEDFQADVEDRLVPAAHVLTKTGLNEAGKAIGRFFAHGLPAEGGEEALFAAVYDQLARIRTDDDMLPAAELDIMIDRHAIARRQSKKLRLRTREFEF